VPALGGRWPRSLEELTTHPRHIAPDWAKHVQGVALTDDWWFITQEDRVWRFPKDGELARVDPDDDAVRSAGIPSAGVDHLGDCDYWQGHLYVAMEGTNPARIGVFDDELEFVDSASVDVQGTSNPWCAVDPLTGLLYSSAFETDHLVAYEQSLEHDGLDLRPCRTVPLRTEDGHPLELERVQGGVFTPGGQLYLTVDCRDGGVLGVDVETGRRSLSHGIEREPGWPDRHVVEGLAYGSLDGNAPAGMTGRLHVLVFDGERNEPDYLWFRHYREQY
jgi:hypothetical protein